MTEESGGCPPEEGFPQDKARKHPQAAAKLHLPSAQAEGGEDPAKSQLQSHEQLGQNRQPPMQGFQKVSGRPQQDPRQKTSGQTGPGNPGAHRHSPRFLRGSP